MRKPVSYNITRGKVRQSWNKYNLYNLARMVGQEPPVRGSPTFFQQKWAAKSKARGYHGEHIPEKKWVRLFSRRLLGAVDLPPSYLAKFDGSEQAQGRGSGRSNTSVSASSFQHDFKKSNRELFSHPFQRPRKTGDVNRLLLQNMDDMTPYMQMAFAPLERRLDTAVFRALFASSVRQARQFVIHGAVKVNGKKMVHPSYQLNPGDMFQVDPEKVLMGTGAQKDGHEQVRERARSRQERENAFRQRFLRRVARQRGASAASTRDTDDPVTEASAGEDAATEGGEAGITEDSLTPEEAWQMRRVYLRDFVLPEVKKILSANTDLNANQKIQLRLFKASAKRFLSQPPDSYMSSADLLDALGAQLESQAALGREFEKLRVDDSHDAPPSPDTTSEGDAGGSSEATRSKPHYSDKGLEGLSEQQKERAIKMAEGANLSRDEMRKLAKLLKFDEENPVDETKPYATPWRPRAFMSAFSFIPRYLEVNPYVCSAVYLRHPVARKGMGEVPTPFNYLTNQLAHNWYLERG